MLPSILCGFLIIFSMPFIFWGGVFSPIINFIAPTFSFHILFTISLIIGNYVAYVINNAIFVKHLNRDTKYVTVIVILQNIGFIALIFGCYPWMLGAV